MILRLFPFLFLFFVLLQNAEARGIRVLPYEELVALADVVVIVEPLSNQLTGDKYPENSSFKAQDDFVGVNTTFKVRAVLKGDVSPDKPFVVLHFNIADDDPLKGLRTGTSRPRFVSFALEVIPDLIHIFRSNPKSQISAKVPEPGKGPIMEPVKVRELMPTSPPSPVPPVWLAFLKKRADGRYEAVCDPYDAVDSFQELHCPNGYLLAP
ncbi:MAG: hypothetical protein ABI615_07585 [Chthoniobacterales bacterium]